MIRVRTDEPFWEYAGKDNFLVLPITSHIRKDGGVTFVDPIAKEAAEKYPDLQKRWGYFLSHGVAVPLYRSKTVNLAGIPIRNHYASKVDSEMVETGLYLLQETAMANPTYLFYLQPLSEDIELHARILDLDRIILLEEVRDGDAAASLQNV